MHSVTTRCLNDINITRSGTHSFFFYCLCKSGPQGRLEPITGQKMGNAKQRSSTDKQKPHACLTNIESPNNLKPQLSRKFKPTCYEATALTTDKNSQCYLYYLIVYFHIIYAAYIVGKLKLPRWAAEFLYTGNV